MTRLLASQRVATLAVLSAMALAVVDSGTVNVALPALAMHFGAEPAETILVVSAYQAALLVGLLPSAHISDRFGPRRTFMGGVGLFCAGAMLCAAAGSLPLLIAARVVQGLGAAAVMALGVALLRSALGSDRLGSAIAWNALTVALSAAAGPAIGAAILSLESWPWLFLAGLPLGAIALLAARALPEAPPTEQAIDVAGVAGHAGAVLLFVVGAATAATHGRLATILAAAGGLLLALLVRRGRRRSNPLLPADLLGRPSFAIQTGASVCCFIGQSIGLVALPFHLHGANGPSLLAAGLVLTCWPAGTAAVSLVAGRTSRTLRGPAQCALGGVVLAAGLALSAGVPLAAGLLPSACAAALCGAGFGLFQLANNRALFEAAPVERAAAAGGLQGTARLTGQTAGTLIMALVFARWQNGSAAGAGLAIGAAFALAAALIASCGGLGREARAPVALSRGVA
jgi:MFS transporter, DHA2 family, multidrug resistance protein